jgi:hypothetical protein
MTAQKTTIGRVYDLVSLLRIASMAIDGEQNAGKSFEAVGGGNVLESDSELCERCH